MLDENGFDINKNAANTQFTIKVCEEIRPLLRVTLPERNYKEPK